VRGPIIVFVVSLAKEAAQVVAHSLMRILSGKPENNFEREVADLLRRFLQKLINRSRLMNPGVP